MRWFDILIKFTQRSRSQIQTIQICMLLNVLITNNTLYSSVQMSLDHKKCLMVCLYTFSLPSRELSPIIYILMTRTRWRSEKKNIKYKVNQNSLCWKNNCIFLLQLKKTGRFLSIRKTRFERTFFKYYYSLQQKRLLSHR
jgi:hypothetical protein